MCYFVQESADQMGDNVLHRSHGILYVEDKISLFISISYVGLIRFCELIGIVIQMTWSGVKDWKLLQKPIQLCY